MLSLELSAHARPHLETFYFLYVDLGLSSSAPRLNAFISFVHYWFLHLWCQLILIVGLLSFISCGTIVC